jgi:hypothetical protein
VGPAEAHPRGCADGAHPLPAPQRP